MFRRISAAASLALLIVFVTVGQLSAQTAQSPPLGKDDTVWFEVMKGTKTCIENEYSPYDVKVYIKPTLKYEGYPRNLLVKNHSSHCITWHSNDKVMFKNIGIGVTSIGLAEPCREVPGRGIVC